MNCLGIDPGANTALALYDETNKSIIDYTTISPSSKDSLFERVQQIHFGIMEFVKDKNIDICGIEDFKSYRTKGVKVDSLMKLCRFQGAAIASVSTLNIPIISIPGEIKGLKDSNKLLARSLMPDVKRTNDHVRDAIGVAVRASDKYKLLSRIKK